MIFINDSIRNYTYTDLRIYIFKNYGYRLADDELEIVITWFRRNQSHITVSNLQEEIIQFLSETFPDKDIVLMEDDSSNLAYLYAMLKSNISKK